MNLLGGINNGPAGCPKTAAVCRKSKTADEVYVLAPASTQKLSGAYFADEVLPPEQIKIAQLTNE